MQWHEARLVEVGTVNTWQVWRFRVGGDGQSSRTMVGEVSGHPRVVGCQQEAVNMYLAEFAGGFRQAQPAQRGRNLEIGVNR